MRGTFWSVVLSWACVLVFMGYDSCEAAEPEKKDELFSVSNPQQNPGTLKIGDTILLPGGKYDVITEVLADGRMKTMEDVIISENGEILEGQYKGEAVGINEKLPTISLAPVPSEKLAKDQIEEQKDLARILTSYLKDEQKEAGKAARAEDVKEAQEDVTIEDLLAFDNERDTSSPMESKEQKEKPKQKEGGAIPVGKNLKIPKGAAKKKDLSFMAGCWSRKVHSPNGQRRDRECLCLNQKGKTGKAYYVINVGNKMLCRATVNVRLLSDKQLVYSTKNSICSNNMETITGIPVYCTQGAGELMCSWSIGGGSAGYRTFKYPFTKVNSCPR